MSTPEVSSAMVSESYIRAVNHALDDALEADPAVIVFGEDVGIPNGPFGATKGLAAAHGEDRVFDTPISESAMVGAALGAAMTGLRPVVEIMFADFLFVAMDQIVNQIANTRYVSEGRLTAPLVIRTQQGNTPGACAQHSQSVEALLAHIPGLRVVVPSTPQDAYDCLRWAIASDDPVVVVESRALYPSKGPLEREDPGQGCTGSKVLRDGGDITIVAWGTMVPPALAQADELDDNGIDAGVIDLRWASPLDLDPVVEALERSGRLIVAHEAVRTGGLGAEIVAQLHERLERDFVHRRIGARYAPIPAAPTLAAGVLPQAHEIRSAAEQLLTDVHKGDMSR